MRRLCLLALISAGLGGQVAAQRPAPDSSILTVDRIFASPEFRLGSLSALVWLSDGAGYTTLEPAAGGRPGKDLVRYDAETGLKTILVPASRLVPPGDSTPLDVEEYSWSTDGRRLLIFTNSMQVWRTNTRGDYWVLDLAGWTLKRLGGNGPPSTLMFAKFSPDGGRVGWVRYGEYNIYVEDIASGKLTQLTHDGSRTTINGTFDWVYEEELGLQDGWRWNPDGQSIAYWQLDATGVRDFLLYDVTDSLYAFMTPVQYPKAGQTNSAGRVGVVSAAGGETRWLNIPGDPRNNYIARMEWVPAKGGSKELVIQHMNRLQDTLHVLLADAQTGQVRTLFTEADVPWVEHFDQLSFLNGGKDILWMSERSGWSQLYLISRDGGTPRPFTTGEFDVFGVVRVDTIGKWVYYMALPDNPMQRYLYRINYAKRGPVQRITPQGEPGWHNYSLSPTGRFAVHTYSRFGVPPTISLLGLPEERDRRRHAEPRVGMDREATGRRQGVVVPAGLSLWGDALDGSALRVVDAVEVALHGIVRRRHVVDPLADRVHAHHAQDVELSGRKRPRRAAIARYQVQLRPPAAFRHPEDVFPAIQELQLIEMLDPRDVRFGEQRAHLTRLRVRQHDVQRILQPVHVLDDELFRAAFGGDPLHPRDVIVARIAGDVEPAGFTASRADHADATGGVRLTGLRILYGDRE